MTLYLVHIEGLISLYEGCLSGRLREKIIMPFDAGCLWNNYGLRKRIDVWLPILS